MLCGASTQPSKVARHEAVNQALVLRYTGAKPQCFLALFVDNWFYSRR